METMAAKPILADTNVLLCASAPSRELHQKAFRVLSQWPDEGVSICTSGQVLREYLVVATRGYELNGLGLSLAQALANRDRFEARMKFLDETQAVASRLRGLAESARCIGKQIHDANLVATALAHRVERILTDNTAHFARFGDVVEILDLRAV
jgi:predicted nucleic acid-binding protein